MQRLTLLKVNNNGTRKLVFYCLRGRVSSKLLLHGRRRSLFRVLSIIHDGAFLRRQLTAFNYQPLLQRSSIIQKQPPEEFYKKRCSWKFCKIPRKTPVSEPLFKPEVCNFVKKENLAQVVFCKFCEIFQNIFLYRIPPVPLRW